MASAGILDKHYYQQPDITHPSPALLVKVSVSRALDYPQHSAVRTKRDVIRSSDDNIAVTRVAEDTPGQTLQRNCK